MLVHLWKSNRLKRQSTKKNLRNWEPSITSPHHITKHPIPTASKGDPNLNNFHHIALLSMHSNCLSCYNYGSFNEQWANSNITFCHKNALMILLLFQIKIFVRYGWLCVMIFKVIIYVTQWYKYIPAARDHLAGLVFDT